MPSIRFLSLFVPDLAQARARYELLLGIQPTEGHPDCLVPHPFAAAGPVVFDLGEVKLALYQCDMRGTHPGDVGIGLLDEAGPEAMASRAKKAGANVFLPPRALQGQGRSLSVFMMPDRHFFEVVGPAQKVSDG